uniref:GPI inositol-deacylase n=1 Tax=Neogobius melanostomus TaxID=47308 RepID=A0A8C6WMV2_9GOBI
MRAVSVAFYGLALGLLAIGLRELLTGFEENRCSMTYMFEYPEYRRVSLPRRVARLYPAYGLYLYGEGVYAQETRNLKLSGAPVLFLPGNAGSYKQARSLGSVALRKAENMEGGLHFNVFTVDFNEELVALYGGSLLRQTHFLHESIKAILRLYKHLKSPPQSVVLVGHSMGGVLARALFTLPRFNTNLVTLIITQASPHVAPVLGLDPYLLDFYRTVRRKWLSSEKLRNVTVLSVGGGYRDFQVRSGLTSLPCSTDDPKKISLVVTAVPRTWVSTDHLSIVWCKELVLATVRAFCDLLDPATRQFAEDPERKMAVLNHHFIRHPVSPVGETQKTTASFLEAPDAWSEVNTLRLAYTTPNEGQVKYFLFALSSRRKAYSHFYCRNSGLQDLTSWVYGCIQKNGSSCVHAVDLSTGTEYLPPYKVLVLDLNDLSPFTHLVVAAAKVNGKQFTVECEWQRQQSQSQTVTLPVPHVLSLGLTVSDVTISSSGLLHTVQLQHFHQVYQAFRITVASHCKMPKERLSNVYRLKVPWFREDSLTTIGAPSVTEISGMLHTSRPDNSSSAVLQLHTSPNCQYKVSVRTSLPKVLGQVLRFCGPMVPVYTAVTLLLACGRQLNFILKSGETTSMSEAVAKSYQPHKVILPVYVLHVLLSCTRFEEFWSLLRLPQLDSLTPTVPDSSFTEDLSTEEWPYLLSPLLYLMGATVAFWGSALLRIAIRVLSLILALLHRPSVSRDCGTFPLWTQLLIAVSLTVLGSTMCAALSIFAAFMCHLYRVLRLQMTERSLSHMLNLAPQKHKKAENGTVDSECLTKPSECNGTPLLSETVLQDVRGDLQLHLCLSVLFTAPVILSAPSLLHWLRNMRYSTQLDPDPCWPHFVPLIISYLLLINCNTDRLAKSKLLRAASWLPLPLAVMMLSFSTLHLYRITYFLLAALVPMALCCLL